MQNINGVLILTDEDLPSDVKSKIEKAETEKEKAEAKNIGMFDFSMSVTQDDISKASSIIYIEPDGIVKFLKVKNFRKFQEVNQLIYNRQ